MRVSSVSMVNLAKTYQAREGDDVVALKGVDLEIESGSFVTLLGPSGCGKTTLLDMLGGILQPSSGTLLIDGAPVRSNPSATPGVVFQQPLLLPWRTAIDNVLLPTQVGPRRRNAGAPSSQERRKRAMELLALVNLEGFEEKYPDELSGGMQQRVSIARALLETSGLMLMDEPFSALDEFTREDMNLELLRVWEERKFTVVFVTHNVYEGTFMSDRVIVMSSRPGRVVADVRIDLPRPRTRETFTSPEFLDAVERVRSELAKYWVTDEIVEATS